MSIFNMPSIHYVLTLILVLFLCRWRTILLYVYETVILTSAHVGKKFFLIFLITNNRQIKYKYPHFLKTHEILLELISVLNSEKEWYSKSWLSIYWTNIWVIILKTWITKNLKLICGVVYIILFITKTFTYFFICRQCCFRKSLSKIQCSCK